MMREVYVAPVLGMVSVFVMLLLSVGVSVLFSFWWLLGLFPLDALVLGVKSFVLLVAFCVVCVRWVDVLFQD